jgi:Acetyltransferase (GNAT) domain
MPHVSAVVHDDATTLYAPVAGATQEVHSWVLRHFPPHDIEVAWRLFLERAACPGGLETPEFFLNPHEEGEKPFAVCAFRQADMIGVLTGLHPGKKVVSGLSSRPQCCMTPNSEEIAADALLQGLLLEASTAKLIEVFTWHSTPLGYFERNGFRRKQLQGDVVLDLHLGPKALFNQFHDNRKRNIRAAIRNGIEVSEVTTDDDLAAFWEVHCGWRQSARKKMRAHLSLAKAKRIHQLRANNRRFLARYQGKAIAATHVRFCPGGLIEYAGNCSLDEYIGLRPNDLLIWKTIEWACQRGFTKYSLGAAHPFLRKSGGVVEPIDRYRLDRTFLRYEQVKEDLGAMSRKIFRILPGPFRRTTTKLLSKT